MSLWRKRGTSDTVAPFARHDGQNTPKLFTMSAMTDNDLSIKSQDLSIKSEPYKSTRQELREQIEGLERDYDLLLTKYKLLLAEISEVKESLTTEPVAYINVEERKLEWAHDYISWDTPTVVNLPRIPLYTPPQRTWVGLTEEEQLNVFAELIAKPRCEYEVYKAYELALKEKNS